MASIFTKIMSGEIPADVVYEDEHVMAVRDIAPQAPVHIVIFTRREITGLSALPEDGDHMFLLNAAKKIGEKEGLGGNYRFVINQGADAGQSIEHLHAHLLGGRAFTWPPG